MYYLRETLPTEMHHHCMDTICLNAMSEMVVMILTAEFDVCRQNNVVKQHLHGQVYNEPGMITIYDFCPHKFSVT